MASIQVYFVATCLATFSGAMFADSRVFLSPSTVGSEMSGDMKGDGSFNDSTDVNLAGEYSDREVALMVSDESHQDVKFEKGSLLEVDRHDMSADGEDHFEDGDSIDETSAEDVKEAAGDAAFDGESQEAESFLELTSGDTDTDGDSDEEEERNQDGEESLDADTNGEKTEAQDVETNRKEFADQQAAGSASRNMGGVSTETESESVPVIPALDVHLVHADAAHKNGVSDVRDAKAKPGATVATMKAARQSMEKKVPTQTSHFQAAVEKIRSVSAETQRIVDDISSIEKRVNDFEAKTGEEPRRQQSTNVVQKPTNTVVATHKEGPKFAKAGPAQLKEKLATSKLVAVATLPKEKPQAVRITAAPARKSKLSMTSLKSAAQQAKVETGSDDDGKGKMVENEKDSNEDENGGEGGYGIEKQHSSVSETNADDTDSDESGRNGDGHNKKISKGAAAEADDDDSDSEHSQTSANEVDTTESEESVLKGDAALRKLVREADADDEGNDSDGAEKEKDSVNEGDAAQGDDSERHEDKHKATADEADVESDSSDKDSDHQESGKENAESDTDEHGSEKQEQTASKVDEVDDDNE